MSVRILTISLNSCLLLTGMACIANYSEDELYYRARVDEVNEEEGVASVVFVDYGTKETVPMER